MGRPDELRIDVHPVAARFTQSGQRDQSLGDNGCAFVPPTSVILSTALENRTFSFGNLNIDSQARLITRYQLRAPGTGSGIRSPVIPGAVVGSLVLRQTPDGVVDRSIGDYGREVTNLIGAFGTQVDASDRFVILGQAAGTFNTAVGRFFVG